MFFVNFIIIKGAIHIFTTFKCSSNSLIVQPLFRKSFDITFLDSNITYKHKIERYKKLGINLYSLQKSLIFIVNNFDLFPVFDLIVQNKLKQYITIQK